MQQDFTYLMPTQVRFGQGVLSEIKSHITNLNVQKILIVCGKKSMKAAGYLDRTLDSLSDLDVEVFDDVESDPSVETVDAAVKLADVDAIVALGGGSPIDAAKAVSVVSGNGGNAAEYISGKTIGKPGPPIIAIPTTAGTGSEVTEVSVLSDRVKKFKRSFRSRYMYPTVALDDPELTLTMPKSVTASSGLDALTHAVEAFTSKKSQPIPDSICLEAARLAIENITTAYDNGEDILAREKMMLASLMAGFGITHAGAGLAHGLSYSLWRAADAPHGLAVGFLLPHVMRFNLGYEERRYERLARYLGYDTPEELITQIESINKALDVPSSLRRLGVKDSDIPGMVELGLGGGTKLNPRDVDAKTLESFIRGLM